MDVVDEDSDDDDEAIVLTRWRVATSSSSQHVLLVTLLLPHGPEADLGVVLPLSSTRSDASTADRFIVVLAPMFATPI